MAESALIVKVPEAEGVVGSLRERFDPAARLGVPAHITVLFPFMAPELIDDAILQRIRAAVGAMPAFEFSLAQVARFPATTYFVPDPSAPFVALTERVVREFPQFPPYGGKFPTIIPHLTVADGSASAAESAETALVSSLASRAPITSVCASVTLIENSSGRWNEMHVIRLDSLSGGARAHGAGVQP